MQLVPLSIELGGHHKQISNRFFIGIFFIRFCIFFSFFALRTLHPKTTRAAQTLWLDSNSMQTHNNNPLASHMFVFLFSSVRGPAHSVPFRNTLLSPILLYLYTLRPPCYVHSRGQSDS